VSKMTNAEIVALLHKLAPELVELAKEINIDLRKSKKEDLLLLILLDHHRQTVRILNDLHQILKRVDEDTAVLRRRSEI